MNRSVNSFCVKLKRKAFRSELDFLRATLVFKMGIEMMSGRFSFLLNVRVVDKSCE